MRNDLLEEFKELVIELSSLGEYVAIFELRDSRNNISLLKNGLTKSILNIKEFKKKVDGVRKEIDVKRMKKKLED